MPITRSEFEQGLNTREAKVIRFLDEHPAEAFTQAELASVLGLEPPPTTFQNFTNFALELGSLVQRRVIESKTIGGAVYYACRKKS